MRGAGAVTATAAAVLLLPGDAAAHAFAQRYDLPLPLWHYLVGAGAVVALSFLLVALFAHRTPAPARTARGVALPPAVATVAAAALRAAGLAAFGLLLAVGFLGPQGDWDSNLLPVVVWVVWWVGLTFVCALVGDVWPLLDPWRTVGLLLDRVRTAPLRVPPAVDRWPAVVLFAAFAWSEIVWTDNAVPRKLATAILLWSALAWAATLLAGAEAWRRHADPFALFFGLFGRFAPFGVDRSGGRPRLVVRFFGAGLAGEAPPSAATTAFVILVLGTVGFDGLSETAAWEAAVGLSTGLLYEAGVVHAVGYVRTGNIVETAGLLGVPLLFAAVYLPVAALTGRVVGETAGLVARRFVLTLVPIAVAYHLAHYLSYLLIQGQAALPLVSDPFGRGWDLFGWAGREIDIAVVDMRFVWTSAVVAIVLGHVASVVLAHRTALDAYGDRATASQWPMLALMVAYTMLSLWILAQPIVTVS